MDFDKIVKKVNSLFEELDKNLKDEAKKIEEEEKEEYIEFDRAYDITKKKVDEISKDKKRKDDFKEILSFIFTEYFFERAKEIEELEEQEEKPKYLN